MRAGTLDRHLLWRTTAGKEVLVTSQRLVSFQHRHLAAISYRLTVLNASASVTVASRLVKVGDDNRDDLDPRKTPVRSAADIHLAPVPGYDLAVFHSMAHVIVRDGLMNEEFVRDWVNWRSFLRHERPDAPEEFDSWAEEFVPATEFARFNDYDVAEVWGLDHPLTGANGQVLVTRPRVTR